MILILHESYSEHTYRQTDVIEMSFESTTVISKCLPLASCLYLFISYEVKSILTKLC